MQLGLLRRLQWRRFKEIWELGKRNRGSRFRKDMFRVLGQARICLNQHGNTGGDSAGNRRLWEATGMGTCLLTDWRPNLHEIFKIDEEVVVYRNVDECIDKIDYLLAHEDKRKAIAEAGMKRTHRDYSTRQFAEALVRHFNGVLNA
jgi:spore maturation protein CgeB